jgi:hypothetical protein
LVVLARRTRRERDGGARWHCSTRVKRRDGVFLAIMGDVETALTDHSGHQL